MVPTSFKYNDGCFIVHKKGESNYYSVHDLSTDELCNLAIDIQIILNYRDNEQRRINN